MCESQCQCDLTELTLCVNETAPRFKWHTHTAVVFTVYGARAGRGGVRLRFGEYNALRL
jgi:hypothetical protein